VLASPEGAPLLDTWVGSGGQFGLPRITPFEYQKLVPGETEFLGLKCHVLATPGHAPGSLSFHFPEAGVVFVGDLLFARSIGRTDFQGGDLDLLRNSVQEKIFTLPPDTVVYPGHGPATTVGAEKAHNPFFADW
jgi:glyoxylase-like metal-dependent hydrolase (beta-lactamase superfamily II)